MSANIVLPIMFALANLCALGQGGKIAGVIYERDAAGGSKLMQAGASVFVPGVGTSTTNGNGYYSIDLSQCTSCRPGTTVRFYVNSKAGYTEQDYVIPVGSAVHPLDITVVRNSKLSLNGVVRSKRSGRFLKGIRVTAVIQNSDIKIPAVYTDDNGEFQIVISKNGVADMQAIRLLVSDGENGKYRDESETVFINRFEPVTIDMEECDDCGAVSSLSISSLTESRVYVEKGDRVRIHAEGVIRVGRFVGNSGPGGIPGNKGVAGISLSVYNIFPNWNHGALVFRFGPTDEWKYYDEQGGNEYVAQTSGFIQFNVNDIKQDDNSGSYTVSVTIRR